MGIHAPGGGRRAPGGGGERANRQPPDHGAGAARERGDRGLAGGVEVTGVSYALYQNLSPGYGFTAIAVALLARLNPVGVVGAGLLFGALEAGAGAMQRDAGVPAVAVSVVEAVVLIVVVIASAGVRRPGAVHAPGVRRRAA